MVEVLEPELASMSPDPVGEALTSMSRSIASGSGA